MDSKGLEGDRPSAQVSLIRRTSNDSMHNHVKPRPSESTIHSDQESRWAGSAILTPDETSMDDYYWECSPAIEKMDPSSKKSTHQPTYQQTSGFSPSFMRSPKSHHVADNTTACPRLNSPKFISSTDDAQALGRKDGSTSLQEELSKQSSETVQATKYSGLLPQPESREISLEQLTTEVKSIYNGITVIESRCSHVDRVQIMAAKAGQKSDLTKDHWQALIAIHRTLLHEHHDFLLAS